MKEIIYKAIKLNFYIEIFEFKSLPSCKCNKVKMSSILDQFNFSIDLNIDYESFCSSYSVSEFDNTFSSTLIQEETTTILSYQDDLLSEIDSIFSAPLSEESFFPSDDEVALQIREFSLDSLKKRKGDPFNESPKRACLLDLSEACEIETISHTFDSSVDAIESLISYLNINSQLNPCSVENCPYDANYGDNAKASRCFLHKKNEMKLLKTLKCNIYGCSNPAKFVPVSVLKKMSDIPEDQIESNFVLEDEYRFYCFNHRRDCLCDTREIRSVTCVVGDCSNTAYYDSYGKLATKKNRVFCVRHLRKTPSKEKQVANSLAYLDE